MAAHSIVKEAVPKDPTSVLTGTRLISSFSRPTSTIIAATRAGVDPTYKG